MSSNVPEGGHRLTVVYRIQPGDDARYLLASPHMIASSWCDALADRPIPHNWTSDDGAVDEFAKVLKDKMRANRQRGRAGWRDPAYTTAEISAHLREHVDKGDPRDVAIYCMFLLARSARIEPGQGHSQVRGGEVSDDVIAELDALRAICSGFVALGSKSDLDCPAYISEQFSTFAQAEADARKTGYPLTKVEAVKKPTAVPWCGPLDDEYVDRHLDLVLRAAGSALRYYTMAKSRDDMRRAMRDAMGAQDGEG